MYPEIYFNSRYYAMMRKGGLLIMKPTPEANERIGRLGYKLSIQESSMGQLLEIFEDERIDRVAAYINGITNGPIKAHLDFCYPDTDDRAKLICVSRIAAFEWKSIESYSEGVPPNHYKSFINLVKYLYGRDILGYGAYYNGYDPANYCLQCDYEDDSFMVFSETRSNDVWGDEGFSLELTESNYKYLLRLFEEDNVCGLEFILESKEHGSGTLMVIIEGVAKYSDETKSFDDTRASSKGKVAIPSGGFHDFDGRTKIESKDTLDKIYTLLKTLYDEEFPSNEDPTPAPVYTDQFSYQKDTSIKRLNEMKDELEWFEDRYGSDWEYVEKCAYHVLISMIDVAIEKEASKGERSNDGEK